MRMTLKYTILYQQVLLEIEWFLCRRICEGVMLNVEINTKVHLDDITKE